MDDLIYLLIKLIAGLFGGESQPTKGPGRPGGPTLPRRPVPLGRQPEIRPRIKPLGPPQTRAILGKMPPLRPPSRASAPPQVAAPPATPALVAPMFKPSPPVAAPARSSTAVDAAAIRRWLRPATLHNQFILSEIFQPPLSMRPPP